jgi:hypothetical protein
MKSMATASIASEGSSVSDPSDGSRTAGGPDSTIGEMATEFGVSLRTLRFYEDRKLLRPRREGATRL